MLLILILKTSKNIESTIWPGEDRVRVGSNGKAKCNSKCRLGGKLNNSEVDDGEVNDNEIEKKDQKRSKSKKTVGSLDFFIFKARLTFIDLRQVFIKALILHHFDLERHI